jgi:hypothetical protein
MLLKYKILESKLKPGDEEKYIPRTILNVSISDESLIEKISFGSTVTPSDCKAVLMNLERVVAESQATGSSVNLGFINLKPSIKGTFSTPDEPFTKGKHKIRVTAVASGSLLRRVTEKANPARISSITPSPEIFRFYNSTLERARVIRSGDLMELRGSKLKFSKEDENSGVFFLKEDGTSIRASEYSIVNSALVIFKAPEGFVLEEKWQLEVRASIGSELRTGRFKKPFEVIA